MNSPMPASRRRLIPNSCLAGDSRCRGPDCHDDAVLEAGDAEVIARMRTAVRVMRAAGVEAPEVDENADASAHLRRAVLWQRYRSGPVSDLHRACGADIVRGSLRLWALAGGRTVPAGRRNIGRRRRSQLARVHLTAQARRLCAAARAQLAAEAANLPRRALGTFDDRVRREVRRIAADMDAAVAAELAECGLPADASDCTLGGTPDLPLNDLLPPRRRAGLENRLTTLLGAAFGAGVSLTAGRVAAELRPDWMPVTGWCAGLLGLLVTTWTVTARRLLAERASAERRAAEALANLRPILEERALTRLLVAEAIADAATPNYRLVAGGR